MTEINDNEERISDFGRFRLMQELEEKTGIKRGALLPGSTVIKGSGDIILSHSVMLEGIHFNMVYTPPIHLGYKAIVAALSGLIAAGLDKGESSLVIGVSSRFETEVLEKVLEGAKLAGEKYNYPLISFDVSGSATGITLSISAWGNNSEGKFIEPTPSVNDIICVTGNLGASFAGLQILERERKLFLERAAVQPELERYSYVVGRQLKPELKSALLEKLSKENIKPTSSLVIIEGLASDIIGLCNSRGVGARIYRERIPIDTETAFVGDELNIEPLTMALNGGEDFEFLLTFPLSLADKIRDIEGLHIIGYISEFESGTRLIIGDGAEAELTAQGW